ncbi:MAG TPA: phosphate signaling complex protein PhoU [Candidatus Hydrogenedentes bacterium]|nr:phosphate signaling complex protein PhoU [Candidatus Hydrogenedentota bacterium]HPG66943.1 phosphate signaling complex protein PhoU [Candidatus Hydrogenedentota bacterium]
MSKHLQHEIEKLKKRILGLSAVVEDTVYRAIKALNDRDATLAQSVIDADAEIDLSEVDIEEECQKILALHQPVAHDLRFIIAVLKINAELEHIGDATVNISERVLFLVGTKWTEIPLDFPSMAQKAQAMLHKSLDALVNLDAALAHEVIQADDEVDEINAEMYGQLEKRIQMDPGRVDSYINLLGISHHIERIADLASNIAEDVVYLVEGRIVRHRTGECTPTSAQE